MSIRVPLGQRGVHRLVVNLRHRHALGRAQLSYVYVVRMHRYGFARLGAVRCVQSQLDSETSQLAGHGDAGAAGRADRPLSL